MDTGRLPQQHVQCRKNRQTTGSHPAFVKSHCPLLDRHAKARLAGRIYTCVTLRTESHCCRSRTITGFVDEFEEIDDHRSGKIVVQLNGRINKCGVISPRYNVGLTQIENWVNQILPARSFGYLILTTSAGIMDHEEARRKHVAGKVSLALSMRSVASS